jgi:hypothetical protein
MKIVILCSLLMEVLCLGPVCSGKFRFIFEIGGSLRHWEESFQDLAIQTDGDAFEAARRRVGRTEIYENEPRVHCWYRNDFYFGYVELTAATWANVFPPEKMTYFNEDLLCGKLHMRRLMQKDVNDKLIRARRDGSEDYARRTEGSSLNRYYYMEVEGLKITFGPLLRRLEWFFRPPFVLEALDDWKPPIEIAWDLPLILGRLPPCIEVRYDYAEAPLWEGVETVDGGCEGSCSDNRITHFACPAINGRKTGWARFTDVRNEWFRSQFYPRFASNYCRKILDFVENQPFLNRAIFDVNMPYV